MKKALVFGAGGQAGSYLCELLLSKGYKVVGAVKSKIPGSNLDVCMGNKNFGVQCHVDIRASYGVSSALETSTGYWDEVYNMTGKMFVPHSWEEPNEYIAVNGLGPGLILNVLRHHPSTKFFNAGSAEVFKRPQAWERLHEGSERDPLTPYGCAKYMAECLVKSYRTKYKLFACTGIFFNMESSRRPRTFFAQKVASEAVRVSKEYYSGTVSNPVKPVPMKLGLLKAERDWGLTSEYVEAAWEMMQAKSPEDYVIGSGRAFSCWRFVKEALHCAGICPDQTFSGFVDYDQTENGVRDRLACNPSKIEKDLGWVAKSAMPKVVEALVREEMQRWTETVAKSTVA
jgi:GDPmannose 4,6-dehydratase